MQSDTGTEYSSPRSANAVPLTVPLRLELFTITREDAQILEGYVEEFEDADADLWATLVRNIMAELLVLWSEDVPFDKIDASKVSRCVNCTMCIPC
jgi:hypothetical protein